MNGFCVLENVFSFVLVQFKRITRPCLWPRKYFNHIDQVIINQRININMSMLNLEIPGHLRQLLCWGVKIILQVFQFYQDVYFHSFKEADCIRRMLLLVIQMAIPPNHHVFSEIRLWLNEKRETIISLWTPLWFLVGEYDVSSFNYKCWLLAAIH